jgi:hypothetical protein
MATKIIRNPKIIAIVFIATFFFMSLIVCFVIGGTDFGRKYPKVLNYANSMCQVDRINYKIYECHARYSTYTCYGPIWDAYYGENRTIYAKVEIETRYRSAQDAFNKAKEYQVRKINNENMILNHLI